MNEGQVGIKITPTQLFRRLNTDPQITVSGHDLATWTMHPATIRLLEIIHLKMGASLCKMMESSDMEEVKHARSCFVVLDSLFAMEKPIIETAERSATREETLAVAQQMEEMSDGSAS